VISEISEGEEKENFWTDLKSTKDRSLYGSLLTGLSKNMLEIFKNLFFSHLLIQFVYKLK